MVAPYLYTDFSGFLRRFFPFKVQKVMLDAGFTCPNRDGTKGRGGCTYCNNEAFNPSYCQAGASVADQLEAGKAFFSGKYQDMKILAYFQAYTNTYGEADALMRLYEEALSVREVVGLVIGTRPDCMPPDLLEALRDLARRTFLLVEYGIESLNDDTLLRINRGHTAADAVDAVCRTAEAGIRVGAHVILGLPGEGREESVRQASLVSRLPLDVLKIHQLQLIRGTAMAREWASSPGSFHFPTVDEYIDRVIDYVERLRPEIALERFVSQSPGRLLVAPRWGLKPHVFAERLRNRMRERGTFQGRLWRGGGGKTSC